MTEGEGERETAGEGERDWGQEGEREEKKGTAGERERDRGFGGVGVSPFKHIHFVAYGRLKMHLHLCFCCATCLYRLTAGGPIGHRS